MRMIIAYTVLHIRDVSIDSVVCMCTCVRVHFCVYLCACCVPVQCTCVYAYIMSLQAGTNRISIARVVSELL